MLSREQKATVRSLFPFDPPKAAAVIAFLENVPEDQRTIYLKMLEVDELNPLGLPRNAINKARLFEHLLNLGRDDTPQSESLLFPSIPPWEHIRARPPHCDRCGDAISGKYYKLDSWNLCRRCMRRVRIRRRVFASRPNRDVQRLVRSALKDLRQAARYDRHDEQIRTNLMDIRPLASAAGGSGLAFFCFWAPLWLVVRGWDYLTTNALGFLGTLVGGAVAVVCLWREGGRSRTAGMALGAILGLAVLLGGTRWGTKGWTELRGYELADVIALARDVFWKLWPYAMVMLIVLILMAMQWGLV